MQNICKYSTVGLRKTCCWRITRLEFPGFLRTCQARKLQIIELFGYSYVTIPKHFALHCIKEHHFVRRQDYKLAEIEKIKNAARLQRRTPHSSAPNSTIIKKNTQIICERYVDSNGGDEACWL